MGMNWKRRLIALITRKKYQAFIEDTKYPERSRERLWHQEIVPLLKKYSLLASFITKSSFFKSE